MANFHGAAIDYPPRVNPKTGSIVTTSDKTRLIVQSIEAILQTRKFERVMLPDFGLPDFIFDVVDEGFAARLAFHLKDQIDKYCPLVESIEAIAAVLDDGRVSLKVVYRERGSSGNPGVAVFTSPRNTTYPVWQYVGKTAE